MTGRYSRRILGVKSIPEGVTHNHPEEAEDALEVFLEKDESHSKWMCNRSHAEKSDIFSHSDAYSMSSVSSWDEDEFESETSRNVQQIFDDIDEILFENKKHSAHRGQTFLECQDWLSKYPHIRIVGQQIVPENDSGFKVFAADARRPRTVPPMFHSTSTNSEGLALQGKSIEVLSPSFTQTQLSKGLHQMLQEVDEVIEQHGEYEELIAADYSDETSVKPDNFLMQTNLLVPESNNEHTPNPSDLIIDLLADRIWNEVLGWIRPFVCSYFHCSDIDESENIGDVKISSQPSAIISAKETQSHFSNIHLSSAPFNSLRIKELDNLLTISSKILQNPQVRQINSLPCTSQLSSHNNQDKDLILASDNQHFRSGRTPSGRLAPLDQQSLRKPSAVSLGNDRLLLNIKGNGKSSPVIPSQPRWRKNFALPPIELSSLSQSQVKKLPAQSGSHLSRTKGRNSKLEHGIRPNTNPQPNKNDLSLGSPLPRPLTQWKDTRTSIFRSQRHSMGINLQTWLSGDSASAVRSKSLTNPPKIKYVCNHKDQTEAKE